MAFHPPSYAARVRTSRGQCPRSLFDRVPDRDEPQTPAAATAPSPADPLLPPAPPGALNDGTVISPPGTASRNGAPEVSPFPLARTLRSRLGLIPSRAVRPRWRGRSRKEKETTSCQAPSWPYRYFRTVCLAALHRRRRERQRPSDILTAVRTLKRIEQERRPATPEEKQALARFGGFGAVALSIFPDPVTGHYKDASWQGLRRGAEGPADARGVRLRQTHHLQRLLHLAHRHRRHPSRPSPAWAYPPTPRSSSRAAASAIS